VVRGQLNPYIQELIATAKTLSKDG
jgi:hypothetical protein